ncbi:MAG: iron ABC transporter permease, partial [Rhizobiales bacterium]|nr:iron ABC transporter permease [Hyphomicrobiales bacterium]
MTTARIDPAISPAASALAAGFRARRDTLYWRLGAGALALLALAPVIGLVHFALRGSGALWPQLATTVLPRAGLATLQLLAGVGVVVVALGIGAAWLTTMYRFPGRRLLEV